MDSILISVILPIYNVEKYLKKSIDSVIGQSYKNLEIILVDDGATDSSQSFVMNMLKKIIELKLFIKKTVAYLLQEMQELTLLLVNLYTY